MVLISTTTDKSLFGFCGTPAFGVPFFSESGRILIIRARRHKAVLSAGMRKRKSGMRLYSSYYPKKLLLLQGLYLIMSMV